MQTTDSIHAHEHTHTMPMKEWLKVGLLWGLGVYFVTIIVTGSLTNYINIRFSWLSYVAAVLFLLLGAAGTYRLLARRQHHHDHTHDHDHQDHGVVSWVTLVVVAVPLVLGTLIPSRPLGAAAVDGDLSASSLGGDGASVFGIPPEQRNILDWVRAFNTSDDSGMFNSLPVDVVGFVYRGQDYPEDHFLVARFTISCCVADSVAIGLPVAWPEALPADTWVRVQGQFFSGEFQGESQPVIRPTSVEIVPQPEHPYLYP